MKHALARWLVAAGAALVLCSPAAAQWSTPPGSSLVVPPGGTVDLACVPLDMQGTLELNGGLLTSDTDAAFGSGALVTGTGGTISVGGDVLITGALALGSNNLELRDGCGIGNTSQLTGTIVVQNLTIRSSTGRTFVLPAGAHITVLGALTIEGAPGLPVVVQAASGTSFVTLGPAATVARTNATVVANVQIGPGSSNVAAIPTLSEYGLMFLSLLMAGAVWHRRRTLQG